MAADHIARLLSLRDRVICVCGIEDNEDVPALDAAIAALRAEAGAVDYPAEFMASMRKAVDNIDVPKMSPLKQELFKAGCVATINAINLALAQARRADRE